MAQLPRVGWTWQRIKFVKPLNSSFSDKKITRKTTSFLFLYVTCLLNCKFMFFFFLNLDLVWLIKFMLHVAWSMFSFEASKLPAAQMGTSWSSGTKLMSGKGLATWNESRVYETTLPDKRWIYRAVLKSKCDQNTKHVEI